MTYLTEKSKQRLDRLQFIAVNRQRLEPEDRRDLLAVLMEHQWLAESLELCRPVMEAHDPAHYEFIFGPKGETP